MLKPSKAKNEPERLQALKDLNIINTPISPPFEKITSLTKSLFNVPMVAITLIDDEQAWIKSSQDLGFGVTSRESSFCAHTILQDSIFIVNDASKDDRFFDNPYVTDNPNIRFYAGCPVKTKDGCNVGSLCIIDNKQRSFTEQELEPIKNLAALVEQELINHKLTFEQIQIKLQLDEAKRAKLIDPLTSAWNREGIQKLIDNQILECNNNQNSFGIFILDIDNFKHVNDTYGHNAGDEVIRQIVQRVTSGLNNNDNIGRWGGEEFVALIPVPTQNKDLNYVFNTAEQTRIKVCELPVKYDGKNIKVSITIGLTIYDGNSNIDSEHLVGLADKALYEGKNSGKNKTIVI